MIDRLNLKTLKIVLYALLFIVASILFLKWQALNAPAVTVADNIGQNTALNTSLNNGSVPGANVPALPVDGSSQATSGSVLLQPVVPAINNLITVNTPLMQVKIDPNGGKIVAAVLSQYKAEKNSNQPFQFLDQNPNGLYYVVESGLVAGSSLPSNMVFTSAQRVYTLQNEGQITVDLNWHNAQGLNIVKTFTFSPSAYTIAVNYNVQNNTKLPWSGRFYGELTRSQPPSESSLLNSYTNYTGAAISSPADHYQKVKFATMAEQNLSQTASGGWVAMLQHYFISAWIPSAGTANITQFSAVNNGLYSIGMALPTVNIAPGASDTIGATLYVGPAIAEQLKAIAPYLDKTVDYGWLWFISELIFSVMKWIFGYVGNWGVAIILVTFLIKLIFYPLSAKSYLSMAKMRELQPKVKALREKMGGDRQKLGVATMELYRKEKVNPLGGCLPIMVQIPVFIGLYWVLMESVELRQAPFFGWIHDLSIRDPYFILPILMGTSMFVQQRLNPPPPDPMQAKIMMFLPLVFTVMFLGFPAGLVLYWLVNNCLSVLQQWWVMSRYRKKAARQKE